MKWSWWKMNENGKVDDVGAIRIVWNEKIGGKCAAASGTAATIDFHWKGKEYYVV